MTLDEAIEGYADSTIWSTIGISLFGVGAALCVISILLYMLCSKQTRAEKDRWDRTRSAFYSLAFVAPMVGTVSGVFVPLLGNTYALSAQDQITEDIVERELSEKYLIAETKIIRPNAGIGNHSGKRWAELLTGQRIDEPAEIAVVSEDGAHYIYQISYRDSELTLHDHHNQLDPDQLLR